MYGTTIMMLMRIPGICRECIGMACEWLISISIGKSVVWSVKGNDWVIRRQSVGHQAK